MKKISLDLLLTFALCSCASYVNHMHKKFDEYDKKQEETKKDYQEDEKKPLAYCKKDHLPYKSNLNITKLLSKYKESKSTHYHSRQDKSYLKNHKQHKEDKKTKQRYKARDLSDNDDHRSLWINNQDQNQVNYLFTKNETKQVGDIVLIHVYNKFKNEITQELKRIFPKKKKIKKTPKSPENSTQETSLTSSTVSPEEKGKEEKEIHNNNVKDKISGIIFDEIKNNHLLIKGRKQIFYSNRKRTIEVQALVARNAVNDSDVIKSDDFLDFSIEVVKK